MTSLRRPTRPVGTVRLGAFGVLIAMAAMLSPAPTATAGVTLNGQTFNTPQSYSNLDFLTITNCTFENITGTALKLTNIGTVTIENTDFIDITGTNSNEGAITGRQCGTVEILGVTLENITGGAIRFPYTNGAPSSDQNSAYRTDSITIDGCVITDITEINGLHESAPGIRIFQADDVTIENTEISYTENQAIWLGSGSVMVQRVAQNGSCLVQGNTIHHSLGDGVLVQENVYNAWLIGNEISYIAYDGVGSRTTAGDHGTYF